MTPKFTMGQRVTKIRGSRWTGLVVGTYSTSLTPEGYAVESETELGSVQIYPAAALGEKLAADIEAANMPPTVAYQQKYGFSTMEVGDAIRVRVANKREALNTRKAAHNINTRYGRYLNTRIDGDILTVTRMR